MSSTEQRKLNIGIIGAGKIGGTLARLLTEKGHNVCVANSRGPETLEHIKNSTGASTEKVEDVVKDADIVIVAIPEKNIPELPANLLADSRAIVIDTCNYYPMRDGKIDELENLAVTESEWVARHLQHSVVKCFNNIFFASLNSKGVAKGDGGRIALPVAGDDDAAKQKVIALLDDIGFDGIDAGALAESWRQEPGTPVYCTDLDKLGLQNALGKADRNAKFRNRDESWKLAKDAMQKGDFGEVVSTIRQFHHEQESHPVKG